MPWRASARRRVAGGGGQGGGVTLAAPGLVPDLLGVMPDVPFVCHFRRAVDLSDREPYAKITTYLSVHRDQVAAAFRTLPYLDGVSFAAPRERTRAVLGRPDGSH